MSPLAGLGADGIGPRELDLQDDGGVALLHLIGDGDLGLWFAAVVVDHGHLGCRLAVLLAPVVVVDGVVVVEGDAAEAEGVVSLAA